jgi:large subunit ribosomal protein L22
MEIKAKTKYLRMSSTKSNIVATLVRGKQVSKALDILHFNDKKPAIHIAKLLNSAIANAKHNFEVKEEDLYIKELKADRGPVLKRWRPRAFGKAGAIRKPLTHLSIILTADDTKIKKKKQDKVEAKVVKGEVVESKVDIKKTAKQSADSGFKKSFFKKADNQSKFQRRTGDK